jgi:hypothetical protein
MNDSMTSVPDPAGGMDDELSGISPELVLVDPELARRLREREPAPPPVLWLVPSPAEPAARDTHVDVDQAEEVAEVELPIAKDTSSLVVDVPAEPLQESERLATPDTGPPSPTVPPDTAPADSAPPDTAPPDSAPPDTAPLGADDRADDGEPAANVASTVALPLGPPESQEPVLPKHVDESPATSLGLPPAAPTTDRDAPPDVEPSDRTAASSPVSLDPPTHHAAPPSPVSLAPPTRRRRRGRRALVFLLGVAAATAGVLVATAVMEDRSTTEPTISSTPGAGTSSPPAGNAAGQAGTRARNGTAAGPVTKPPAARKSKPGSSTPPKAKAKPKPKPTPKAKATPKPTPKKSKQTGARKSRTASPVEPRRFAWAPADGAVGYHVELFRGSDRILARETKQPVLELGTTWRYEGKVVRLTPGTYRWYVWPVTKNGRAVQAIVQAKLEVP